jgi:hypothetical protein
MQRRRPSLLGGFGAIRTIKKEESTSMKTMALATAALLAALTTAHAHFTNKPDHRLVGHYYTVSVPNKPDGTPDTLNVRSEPRGKIVDHFDEKHSTEDNKYEVVTVLSVIQKKDKWWYVTSDMCGDKGITGWVNSKYLVEHPIWSDDACGC